MKIYRFLTVAALALAAVCIISCNNKKFHVSGNISEAQDSLLYFENMSLDGPVVVDSVKLGSDGSFSFDGDAPEAPDFYRLRIAGQIINVAVDSTDNITVKAAYPTMSSSYDINGNEDNNRIKELSMKQLRLQAQINAIANNPNVSYQKEGDSIRTIVEIYKNDVRNNYIYKQPMKASSYFALFQTVTVEGQPVLIFNPHVEKADVQTYAAVATSWDTFYPGSKRGENLHAIAIAGMKDLRIVEAKQNETIDASKVSTTGVLEIALPDNNGAMRKLTSLKGKVVLLDFHLFGAKGSAERIMKLRDLYNKYHAQGFEIYQVSLDPDEHFWKESVAALPWISVHDDEGLSSGVAAKYNVQSIPTFFLIDRSNTLQKRDAQVKDLDAEIQALL